MVISTEQFGDLVLDPDVDWFEGTADWNGKAIRVVFPVDEETLQDNALASGKSLWSDQSKWNKSIETYVVESLLSIKNETWLEDDETEVTADQFQSRIVLETISIASDGDFEFWYNDGDLFAGHAIVVRGNLELGLIEACVEG
jgi:hypothetical protein